MKRTKNKLLPLLIFFFQIFSAGFWGMIPEMLILAEEETEAAVELELDLEEGTVTADEEFRFTQTDKVYAIVSNVQGCCIYEEQDSDSQTVGELDYYGLCYLLSEEESGYYYVESGNVRGFVRAADLLTGDAAGRIVAVKGEDTLLTARMTASRTENDAYTYTLTTTQEVLQEKDYAIADTLVYIYETPKASADLAGILQEGGICYILERQENGWLYVESGDVRGFVMEDNLILDDAADAIVKEEGEGLLPVAVLSEEPQDNPALYYRLTSIKDTSNGNSLRSQIVNFALQFVGNPYVWGGTSLTNGADCSGFVMSVFANFGIYLPRVASDQAQCGTTISISEAQPGDLIFYSSGGYIYHVAIYIGDGQIVHAAGSNYGIITSGISSNACSAVTLIG